MANSENRREERCRATTRQWSGPERRSRFAAGAGQLLERGDGVADPVGSLDDARDLITSEGERGSNIGDRFGGSVYNPNDLTGHDNAPTHDDREGTAGAGEGDPDDAPNYGDWNRHSTGATSSGLQHEGFAFPGEDIWGEHQSAEERKDESNDGSNAGAS